MALQAAFMVMLLSFISPLAFAARSEYENSAEQGRADGARGPEAAHKEQLNVGHDHYLTKDKRILVVGAGPAGLHIARELQKRGFTNITIVERTDRVGGKSYTRYLDGNDKPCTQRKKAENGAVVFDKKCVAIEYGTCFLHNGYHRVRDLVHEYGLRSEARTWNVLQVAKGFDFVQQVDAEEENVLHKLEEARKDLKDDLNTISDHIGTLREKLIGDEALFREKKNETVAPEMTKIVKTLAGDNIDEFYKLDVETEFKELNKNLFDHMDKGQSQTWQTGAYTNHMVDVVMQANKMRDVSSKLENTKIGDWKLMSKMALEAAGEGTTHFVNSVLEYVALRKKYFGEPKFKMPDKLNPEMRKELSKSFRAFLVDHKLQALVPFFQVAHAAQGYGYLWEVPAYYGLHWMSPDFVLGVLAENINTIVGGPNLLRKVLYQYWGMDGDRYTHLKQVTTMLPEGYNAIWREMHAAMTADNDGQDLVQYDVVNLKIDRRLGSDDPISASWTDGNNVAHEGEFDHLIYTGPLRYMKDYMVDAQVHSEEERIFSRLEAFTFAVTLYRSDVSKNPMDGYTNRHLTGTDQKWNIDEAPDGKPWKRKFKDPATLYNADNIVDGPRSDFMWYVDRNDGRQWTSEAEYNASYATSNRRIAGQFSSTEVHKLVDDTTGDRFAWWGTGELGSGGMGSESKAELLKPWLREKLKADFEAHNIKDVEVLEEIPWPYFWHFPGKEIEEGLPWDLKDMQGKHKTWYLGASSSFESINDIVNYNDMMLDMSVFENFSIKAISEYAVDQEVQDLDGFYDTDAECCCDAESQCTLVPEIQLHKRDGGCPKVFLKSWPMTKERHDSFGDAQILQLKMDKTGMGCKDLDSDKVVILTNHAYASAAAGRQAMPFALFFVVVLGAVWNVLQ